MKKLFVIISIALSGCSGGGDSNSPTDGGTNSAPNLQAPSVSITIGQRSIQSGQTITALKANALDRDGVVLIYKWSNSSNCKDGSWANSGTSSPSFTAPLLENETSCTLFVTVIDNDGLSATAQTSVTITPNTAQGLLSRTWHSGSTAIDPNNLRIFPRAALSDSGDAVGAWLVSYNGRNGIEAGYLPAGASEWSVQGEISSASQTALTDYQFAKLAVEAAPNGYAVATWVSRNTQNSTYSIWASVSPGDGLWGTAKQISSGVLATHIKASINNQGTISIIWSDLDQQIYAAILDSTLNLTTPIEKVGRYSPTQARESNHTIHYTNGFQSFVDQDDEVHIVAINNGTETGAPGLFYRSFTPSSGWSTSLTLSTQGENRQIKDADFSQSRSGNMIVAWQVAGNFGFDDVKGRVYSPQVGWSEVINLESRNDSTFFNPHVSINDAGEAFLAMGYRGPDDGGLSDIYLSRLNKDGRWMVPKKVHTYGHSWVDVAIDEFGHSLLVYEDIANVTAGIFDKDGAWRGASFIGYSGTYHGMTDIRLRMLPNSEAILTWAGVSRSGYRALR